MMKNTTVSKSRNMNCSIDRGCAMSRHEFGTAMRTSPWVGLIMALAVTMVGASAWAAMPSARANATSTATAGASGSSQGGALYVQSGTVTLTDTILWNDTAATGAEVYVAGGATVTVGTSVVAGVCPTGATCSGILGTDPLLGALGNNGGPTPTMLPGAGSPGIDAGVGCAATDQRGITRPQGSACDIGAVEVIQYALAVTVTGSGTVSAGASPSAQSGGVAACGSGGANCTARYVGEGAGTPASVALTAMIPAGQHVTWGGACAAASSGTTATVTMSAAASCTAAFAPDQVGQTITFTSTPPAIATVGGSYTVTANATSGLTVTFSIDAASTPGACTIAGSVVTFTGAGTCIIDANQAGNAAYSAAPQRQQTMAVQLAAVPTPTLDRWVLLALGMLLGLIGFKRARRA